MDCMRLDALQEDDEVRANLAKELGLSADKTNSNAGQSVSDMDAWEREMKAELEGELPCPRFLPTGSRFNYTVHRYYVRLKAVRSDTDPGAYVEGVRRVPMQMWVALEGRVVM